ncbi:hypothetical protein A2V82_08770 [candidate division KSB1 bacterium RBG_16_48_16]|nr:MAG: hypothetical protein A2V82_08770 [candidate division KSB1 bacterium RBG_16_48_16]
MKNAVRLSPLLLLYFIVVLFTARGEFWHDEIRYVNYATNITKGYYSPPGEIHLKNGPGYPLLLAPFVLFHIPWLAARLVNAVFLFLAVFYLFLMAKVYARERWALTAAYIFGCYPPFLRFLPVLITEIFSVFLVSGFVYHICRSSDKKNGTRWHPLFAGLYLGWLSLTKVFFGYVIVCGGALYLMATLLKKRPAISRVFIPYIIALFLSMPYLFYTYHLTGKFYYWGTVGGMSLYWLTSPYSGDLGDWQSFDRVKTVPELAENHLAFFTDIEGRSEVEQDEAFRAKAIENFKSHPAKFFKNWLANWGRLFFNYPYSYTLQKPDPFLYIIPNAFLLMLVLGSLFPAVARWSSIPFEFISLACFAVMSIAGMSLLSAYGRFLLPMVPVFAVWIVFVYLNLVKIRISG